MQGIAQAVADDERQVLVSILDTMQELGWSGSAPRLFFRKTYGWIIWPDAPENWPEKLLALASYGRPLAPFFIEAVREGYDFMEHGDKLRVTKGR